MDLFFDDEDDMPDSAFGQPIQSKESGLPLRDSAANPAGHSSLSFGQPSGFGPGAPGGEQHQQPIWSNDGSVHVEQPNAAFPGPGPLSSAPGTKKSKGKTIEMALGERG